jgi:wyosine [tRNA(Phe)-imidazoG37] synthetase (radical SAM superfamily)
MSIPLQNSVVYGPVGSRRLGRSLGLNILPVEVKFCLSDCVYCQYGRTNPEQLKGIKLPKAAELLEVMEKEFARLARGKQQIDSITFSGNGEPTLHPDFPLLVTEVKKLRDRHFPGIPVSILSDSTQIRRPEIREALSALDSRYMKLDAGDQRTYETIDHVIAKITLAEVIENLKKIPDIIIQSLFISAPVDNTEPSHVAKWIEAVGDIRPKAVHIYTIARSSAEPSIRAAAADRLREIAVELKAKTSMQAVVF